MLININWRFKAARDYTWVFLILWANLILTELSFGSGLDLWLLPFPWDHADFIFLPLKLIQHEGPVLRVC